MKTLENTPIAGIAEAIQIITDNDRYITVSYRDVIARFELVEGTKYKTLTIKDTVGEDVEVKFITDFAFANPTFYDIETKKAIKEYPHDDFLDFVAALKLLLSAVKA